VVVVPKPETEPPIITGVTVNESDVYNVLLIGIDKAASLTDTIMVISINRASKKAVITSFMRDMKVYDPNYGWCRINGVYVRKLNATGSKGAAVGALANVLNYNFGITIHNYATVNFDIFIKVVDVLGGVDVPLYYSEYLYMTYHTFGENKMSGLEPYYEGGNETGYVYVHLNAEQALVYARMRSNVYNPYTGTYDRSDDRFRNERQRHVIYGLMRRVRELDLDKIQAIAQQVLPMVTTDLDYNSFLSRLMTYLDYKKYSITSFAIPVRFSWDYGSGGYIEIFDFDRNKREWREYVYS
jgi:LCP family protein required for cell wall assembly